MRKYIAILLLMLPLFCAYNICHSGSNYYWLSREQWGMVWTVLNNGITLTLFLFIGYLLKDIKEQFIKSFRLSCYFVFAPYFALKIIYEISCKTGIPVKYWPHEGMTPEIWESVWSYGLVYITIAALILCLIIIHRSYVITRSNKP